MDLNQNKPRLSTHGYEILSAENLNYLKLLRDFISQSLIDIYRPQLPSICSSDILNNAHNIANVRNDSEANSMVLDIIKLTNDKYDFYEYDFMLLSIYEQR